MENWTNTLSGTKLNHCSSRCKSSQTLHFWVWVCVSVCCTVLYLVQMIGGCSVRPAGQEPIKILQPRSTNPQPVCVQICETPQRHIVSDSRQQGWIMNDWDVCMNILTHKIPLVNDYVGYLPENHSCISTGIVGTTIEKREIKVALL